MRKIPLLIGALLLCLVVSLNPNIPNAHAVPGFVQQKAGASATTQSTGCVYGTNPIKNNFLIVSFSWYPTTITVTSVTDTLLNTFTDAGILTGPASTQTFKSDVWYTNQAATTGADTITILLSSAPTFIFFTCLEFSQIQKTLRVAEKTGTGTYTSGTSFTASVTSFTPTVTDMLYAYTGFLACSATGTITYATGFTAGTGKGTDAATGTNCITSGAVKYKFNEADQYFPNTGTTATTASFAIADSAPSINTGGWAEIVLEFEFKSFQSISNTITLASAISNPASHPRSLAQSITLTSALTHKTAWKNSLTQAITDASSFTKVAAHFYSLTQSISISSTLAKIAGHFASLAQSITNTGAMNAFISQLFFHGHNTINCLVKVQIACDYQSFFTEAPASASAILHPTGHRYSIANIITIIAPPMARFQYSDMLAQSITIVSTFRAVTLGETCEITFPVPLLCHYRSTLIESITTVPAQTKGLFYFLTATIDIISNLAKSVGSNIALSSLIGIDSILTNSANHFAELTGTIDLNGILETLRTPGELSNVIGFMIILIVIIGILLYFMFGRRKRRRRRRR